MREGYFRRPDHTLPTPARHLPREPPAPGIVRNPRVAVDLSGGLRALIRYMTNQHNSSASESIAPTDNNNRVFTTISYMSLWWAALTSIQLFALGQGLLPPIGHLNLSQALLVMALAGAIFVGTLSANGQAGLLYGIPFAIQARASFGVRGSRIIEVLRALPAIIWFGIGTWIATLAVNGILKTLTGFSAPYAAYVYFVVLQALQIWLAYRGIRAMKSFNMIGSIVIAAILIYMLAHILSTYGFHMNPSWKSAPDWGAPFWTGLTSAIGILAPVTLNISDMTRHLHRSERAIWIGHACGVLPPLFFVLVLGMASGLALGIWDPVQALMTLSPNPFVMILLLAFILLAQISANLTINILPPTLILMSSLRISWGRGALLTGALATLSFPWMLMGNAKAFFGFILYYSAFFGPVLGVMLADYFVIRKRQLHVERLYVADASSEYWYLGGFNVAGLLAVFVPGLITMIWCLPVSWLIGAPAGFVLYVALWRSAIPAASVAYQRRRASSRL
jgi:NCS1 family nucleobase:cation symporter-1